MTPPLGGGGALWTTAAAAPDAPPAQPDAGDPAPLSRSPGVFTAPDHTGRASAVPRPVRCRWSGQVALHPTAETRDHPDDAERTGRH
ncbi:MAG: hypothetical protein ACRDR6_26135 [Pseudonocardiaceae bacterium]